MVWQSIRSSKPRLALTVMLLAVLAAFAASEATRVEAHAALIRSSPENGEQVRRPPFRVILYFSEPVEQKLTAINVLDAQGNDVDEDDVELNPADRSEASVGVPTLDPGLYTVEFSNVSSVDGHPWSGIFQFVVLNPDGSVPPNAEFNPDALAGGGTTGLLPEEVDSALRWLALLSLAITAGAAVFAIAVVRPAASFMEDDAAQRARDAGDTWVVTLAHILLPASFIASAILIVISVGRYEPSPPLFEYLTDIRTGRYQLANLALIAIALVGADILYLSSNRYTRYIATALLIAASGGAMLTYSMISHGATGDGKFWSIASDFIHFASSALWLGALVLLIPLLRWARRHLDDDATRFLYLANAFDRFSILAGLSVATVLASGVFNGLVEIPEWQAFTDTTYGRVLLAKLALVALLLPVAGLNAFILKPRFVRTIDDAYSPDGVPAGDPPSRVTSLQRFLTGTVALEVALVVAVFASVAVLTQTSTAKGEIAQEEAAAAARTEFQDVKDAGDLQLRLEIQPNRVGINRYTLTIANQDGSPSTTVTQARLRFRYTDPANPDVAQPQAELLLRPTTNQGEFEGQGSYFTQAGSWQVEAGVRRSDADDVSRTFVVPASPAESPTAGQGGPYALPFDSLSWNEVVAALLVLLGTLLFLYREQIRPLAREAYRVGVTIGAALVIAGAVLWFGVDTHKAVADPSAGNPVEPTADSIEAGRMLFQQNCITCHGAEGRGDGPQAASLDPAPADIRQHLPYHTDPQFFAFIANGVAGTAMPAWRDQFSDEDIWNIINYLRTFEAVPTE